MAGSKELVAGRVVSNHIYPVKSMQGQEMETITLRSVSVVGDRTRAFHIQNSNLTPSHLDTTRFPGLLRYSAFLDDIKDPRESGVTVRTPSGQELSADSPELRDEISRAYGRPLAVVRLGRAAYHSMPVSLLSLASIKELERESGYVIDPRRFRENIIVEGIDDEPYVEDSWVGRRLTFGNREDSPELEVVKLDGRCATVDLNPTTGKRDTDIHRTIVQERINMLGVYATIAKEGVIHQGETIYLSDPR